MSECDQLREAHRIAERALADLEDAVRRTATRMNVDAWKRTPAGLMEAIGWRWEQQDARLQKVDKREIEHQREVDNLQRELRNKSRLIESLKRHLTGVGHA